jgi:hypothetical protein
MIIGPAPDVAPRWRGACFHGRLARMAWWCAKWACSAFLIVVAASAVAAEPKRVLFLHSIGRDFRPWNEYAKHIRMELDRQSPWPLDVHEASLVTARFSDENPEAPFVEYLRALYANHPLDLIVGIGGPAASFVQRHRQQLFPSTPMLLAAVEQRRIEHSGLTANDAVVAVSLDIAGVVQNILQVLPDTKNVAVVIGNSSIEKFWLEQARNDLQPFANRVAFTWYNELPFDSLLKHAAALPPQSAILFAMMSVDAAGIAHEEGKALTRLHAVANAPIFSFAEAYFGEIVGGPLLAFSDLSRPTADAAVRILRGETAGDIKTPLVGLGTPKFDWREMRRWSIPESWLPPGSEIHFRSPSIWAQYRMQAMAAIAVVLLQSAMIGWLLIERNRRRVAEVESRRRLLQIAHMNRSATAGALSASIAHELNQPLGAILSNTEAAEMLLARDPPSIDVVREILADVRSADLRAGEIISRLRGLLTKGEVNLQNIDLNEAIRNVVHILHPEAKDRRASSLPIRGSAHWWRAAIRCMCSRCCLIWR